ncbi:L-alanine exporter AlaE [Pelagibacterium sp. H642]|uniref:L-alanine exporter AlaE n=1 Tax=Pelagibacterium sp. H642 TaxID=1881069 RepID=UPI00281643BF|nr:L-alanine exporter AlaE [Pelagibacterium sp. H642]WMT89486.1 L-alanine exporter AlaE [Pelagibacterium sp. H642]
MANQRLRSFAADTLALVIFFTVVSGLNERFIAGMSWPEVAISRSIGAVLMVLTARPYGYWRDWFLTMTKPATPTATLLMDSVALLSFQVPVYVLIIFAGGARGMGIATGAIGFAVLMLVLGRPYGLWLDFVRRRFGLSGPGQKPMSLGG